MLDGRLAVRRPNHRPRHEADQETGPACGVAAVPTWSGVTGIVGEENEIAGGILGDEAAGSPELGDGDKGVPPVETAGTQHVEVIVGDVADLTVHVAAAIIDVVLDGDVVPGSGRARQHVLAGNQLKRVDVVENARIVRHRISSTESGTKLR